MWKIGIPLQALIQSKTYSNFLFDTLYLNALCLKVVEGWSVDAILLL